MNATKKFYQGEVERLRRKIREERSHLRSEAHKTNYDTYDHHNHFEHIRDVVECEIYRLKQDLTKAKKMLKLCEKN